MGRWVELGRIYPYHNPRSPLTHPHGCHYTPNQTQFTHNTSLKLSLSIDSSLSRPKLPPPPQASPLLHTSSSYSPDEEQLLPPTAAATPTKSIVGFMRKKKKPKPLALSSFIFVKNGRQAHGSRHLLAATSRHHQAPSRSPPLTTISYFFSFKSQLKVVTTTSLHTSYTCMARIGKK